MKFTQSLSSPICGGFFKPSLVAVVVQRAHRIRVPQIMIKSSLCLPQKNKIGCLPIGSMYGIYANIGGILMVNVTIYSIHGSYGLFFALVNPKNC